MPAVTRRATPKPYQLALARELRGRGIIVNAKSVVGKVTQADIDRLEKVGLHGDAVYVDTSRVDKNAGKGLFAREDIPAGVYVTWFSGVLTTQKGEGVQRKNGGHRHPHSHTICVARGTFYLHGTVKPKKGEGKAQMINASTDKNRPNAEFVKIVDPWRGLAVVLVRTTRVVERKREIVIKYRFV